MRTFIFGRMLVLSASREGLEFYVDLTRNKGLEANLYWAEPLHSLFLLSAGWAIKGDHPGLHLELSLLAVSLQVDLYDGRHWNWEEDRFYFPGEEHPGYREAP